ncbi:DUF1501 domain-containing protein [Nocardioides sp. zg-DK7169]|uniref:DUF1501 domain-containing protein n=1 Tax=Nocardioides sp. zg-DK7169 TaxID=2736600 RepID=UPI001551EF1D|nr:DUF1501 domain-containing protein [Nocardioides sp. zg-DK7169]NPC97815.1 DUF1501 domain-containing protein [Nocardioides sp. zg-DK7169]
MTDRPAAPATCEEYAGLSRRGFLRTAALGGAALSTSAVFGTAFVETSYAAPRRGSSVLVVLSLRGAVDGMSLVVPHGDPAYYTARPRIAIPAHQLLVRDGFFGLHPALAPLLPLWRSGRMAAVHATGLAVPNRSHFSAMEAVEDADPGSAARVGWLNRLVGRDAQRHPLRAVQVGSTVPPTSLVGPVPTMALSDVDAVRLAGHDKWDTHHRRPASMRTMWSGVSGPLGTAARTAFTAIDDLRPVQATSAKPANGASYPQGDLGAALASAARTIRGDVGAEVITVDHGDWDHHSGLGTLQWGSMQAMTKELAGALAAFFTDLGRAADRVTVVTISEFGRRTRENASFGLDHGHGNVMLLLGAGVRGGYHGTWTPLGSATDDDLAVTTDYRSVLAEVVTRRLGASSAQVFPGFSPETVGAVT